LLSYLRPHILISWMKTLKIGFLLIKVLQGETRSPQPTYGAQNIKRPTPQGRREISQFAHTSEFSSDLVFRGNQTIQHNWNLPISRNSMKENVAPNPPGPSCSRAERRTLFNNGFREEDAGNQYEVLH